MKKVLSLKILAVVCIVVSIVTMLCANTMLKAGAAGISADYPAVLLRISTYDNARYIIISGYDDKSATVASELKNTPNESWRFDYTGTNSNGSFYFSFQER